MLREMELNNALKAFTSGQAVIVLQSVPNQPLKAIDLSELFAGCRLLVETPDKVKAVEKQTEKKVYKTKVDTGKLFALQDAGWSVAKIADEMGLSSPTVSKYLRNRTKTEENQEEV